MRFVRKDVYEPGFECFGEDYQFSVCYTPNTGFDFGNGVFADLPAENATPGCENGLTPLFLLAELFDLRANNVLRLGHLPFLEVDASEFVALKVSDIGRFSIKEMLDRPMPERKVMSENSKAGACWGRNELWSMLGHDLRTPLNGIQGLLDLLDTTCLDPAQRDYVKTALECVLSLRSILDGILECTQIEAGRLGVATQATNVRELIDSVLLQHRFQANCAGIVLRSEVPPEFPRLISMDQGKLRQILMNLVSNAIKFTLEGSVIVRVTEERSNGNFVVFKVIDTGCCILKNQLSMVFEPFYQCMRKDERGLGLGLTIVRMLVITLDGEAKIESRRDQGTTVAVRLPKKS